ncbi:Protein of unknown function [Filimonas lacunae]|uniref:DUF4238 domain-containing protein n=1 Tax=Filimonas lacunae TaxID=477680 RepID=A0A173MLX9_9BACT|nr:DUF4238 domain-containing protein [Filimonas lacunae]BAV08642.1 hypothetical protein FLA_4689 [Filimonas lacunae]SIS59062.1 Protein of unknown function [Filimonas lacunae]
MKSGQPKNHHYVPKVYLKRFADENSDFFQLCKKYKSISTRHISQVCYEREYFKIQREETKATQNIQDEHYIEKNSFVSQENSLPTLVDLVSQQQSTAFWIPKHQLEALIGTLITIKQRNPTHRQLVTSLMKSKVAAGELEKRITPYLDLVEKMDKKGPWTSIDTIKEQFKNEPSKAEDIYTQTFLEKNPKLVQRVTQTLLQSAVQIYHAPAGHEFFTSDNPGFIASGDIIFNFSGLGGPFTFAFPLSSSACLIISSDNPSTTLQHHVTIYPRECTSTQVDMINQATKVIAQHKIFAKSRNYIQRFKSLFM